MRDLARDHPTTIGHVLDAPLSESPSGEALVDETVRYSYEELDAAIGRAQTVLRDLGVDRGDRVVVSMSNRAEIIVIFYAVARLGAVFVGVNTILALSEKSYILRDCGARVVVTDAAGAPDFASLPDHDLDAVLDVDADSGVTSWRERVERAERSRDVVGVPPEAPVGIAYTSGTTGFPKGVVHSHHNLLMNARVQVATRGYGPTMRRAETLSLTILNVITFCPLIVALAGGTVVVLATNNPRRIAETIRRERATHYLAVPPIAYSLLHDEEVTPDHLATLEEVISGSAALPLPVTEGFSRKFGLWLAMTYGQTEAPAALAMEDREGRGHVPGASGLTLPHVELFSVDVHGAELPPGADGELCVRAARTGPWTGQYTPMLEYWNNPDATAATIKDDHYRTGDIGHVDAEGNVHVVERKSLMINRGGSNVYPAEIERLLVSSPSVAAAAVVGVPDERLGQRIVALVEPAPGRLPDPDELTALCRRELARYKVPESIHVVDEFPRNTMNKIVRTRLLDVVEEQQRLHAEVSAGDGE